MALSVIDDVDRNLGYNLLNADAVHSGIEWDFPTTPQPNGMCKGRLRGQLAVDEQRAGGFGQPHDQRLCDPCGRPEHRRHLGEPRRGEGGGRRPASGLPCGKLPPKRGTYFSVRNTLFWQHYARFSPGDVITEGEPKDVWITPAYALLNFNAGTSFDVSDNALLRVRLSVTNALDVLYVSPTRPTTLSTPAMAMVWKVEAVGLKCLSAPRAWCA